MIAPYAVLAAAKSLEKENLRFRTFLKNRANPDELDRQFAQLHKDLFSQYDCSQCRNCCRAFSVELERDEIEALADFFQLSAGEFSNGYLAEVNGRQEIAAPCRFLKEDGSCLVESCKPQSCRDFPYTDKPDRLFSLYSILSFAEVCPVVLEMLERLKKLYLFRR